MVTDFAALHGIPHRVHATGVNDFLRRLPGKGLLATSIVYLSVGHASGSLLSWEIVDWNEGTVMDGTIEVCRPAVSKHCLRYLASPRARGGGFLSPAASGVPAQVDGSTPGAQDAEAYPLMPSSTGFEDKKTSPERAARMSPAKVLGLLRDINREHRRSHAESMPKSALSAAARARADIPVRALQAAYAKLEPNDRFMRGMKPSGKRPVD